MPDTGYLELLARSEAGDAEAQFEMAKLLYAGDSVPADVPQAMRWLSSSARSGFTLAQYALGVALNDGRAIVQDRSEAYRWLMLASCKGHEEAKEMTLAIRTELPTDDKTSVERSVHLPVLKFILGPPIADHFEDAFKNYQDFKDGDDCADGMPWEEIEDKTLGILFGGLNDSDSALSEWFASVFGCPVVVTEVSKAVEQVSGVWCTTICIPYTSMICEDGSPVCWWPDESALNAVKSMWSLMLGRSEIRWQIEIPE